MAPLMDIGQYRTDLAQIYDEIGEAGSGANLLLFNWLFEFGFRAAVSHNTHRRKSVVWWVREAL